jgi:hypothetical protein
MTTKEPKHKKMGVKTAKNLEDAELLAFALLIGGAGTIAAIIFELA